METLGRNGSRQTKIILNLNNNHVILLQHPFSSILELDKNPVRLVSSIMTQSKSRSSSVEVFYKKDVLKFYKFHKKTTARESLFTPAQMLSCKICETFKNRYYNHKPRSADLISDALSVHLQF